MTSYMNKITVITPESFNEFLSEALDAVSIDELGHLEVTEVLDDVVVGIKVYSPGQWCTVQAELVEVEVSEEEEDRKSTRLNSSHVKISYAVFCLKKKNFRSLQYIDR